MNSTWDFQLFNRVMTKWLKEAFSVNPGNYSSALSILLCEWEKIICYLKKQTSELFTLIRKKKTKKKTVMLLGLLLWGKKKKEKRKITKSIQ